jgi:UPF0716 protein FxsA
MILALLVLVPLVELYVLIQVGQTIGALPTLLLVLATSALGAWLLKREGAKAYRHFVEAVQAHRVPTREVADGALVLAGGLMLLVPGFVSDVIGLLLLLPPTRALLRRPVTALVAGRLLGPLGSAGAVFGAGGRRPARGDVIDGEVVRDDPEGPEGPGGPGSPGGGPYDDGGSPPALR